MPIPLDSDPRKRRAMNAMTADASSGSSQMESSHAVADESRMVVEEEERDEFRSSKAQNIRRRIMKKASMEESKSDERKVAVTTQESSDGIREKALRIANIHELETGSTTARWSSPRGAENDRTGKANEFVRSLVGIPKKGSKSKLWKDMSLKRAIREWNMKYVDIARSPGSAIRVFTSSERLANQLKITEIRRSWRLGERRPRWMIRKVGKSVEKET